eukprot:TRINITY_DN14713_c0_g1_i1.p1 TRINITY_DN14713_c0_g1~~TRINITY_DN14713_c0_g1_i1.p1  ORF type:complete len:294 (+),score=45.30 TRINITY_DN14713_c0_g1_i1:373-1254(+)
MMSLLPLISSTEPSSVFFNHQIVECKESGKTSKVEMLMSYKTLFKALFSEKAFENYLTQQEEKFEYEAMDEELPILVRYFADSMRDNIVVIRTIARVCKYGNVHKIEKYIQLNNSVIIQNSLLNLLKLSLKWSSYEQILLWRIINAHSVNNFKTKENLIYSLCYSINTLPSLEECAEFTDGIFVLLSNWFRQQKEISMEELGYVFGLKPALGTYIYQVMGQVDGKVFLDKVIAYVASKQEATKLANALELMRAFIEIEEKTGGKVIEVIKEDKSFKTYSVSYTHLTLPTICSV